MTIVDLIALCRARLDDVAVQSDGTPAATLWADQELIGFINEAQREACERAKLLRDEVTDSLTLLPIVANQAEYDVDPSVFWIDSARYEDTGRPIHFTSREELQREGCHWTTYSRARAYRMILIPLPTEQLRLRFFPVPTEDTHLDTDGVTEVPTQIRLVVYRYPLTSITSTSSTLEIHSRHHERLVDWVCFRAFSRRDRDTYDPAKASDAETAFIASFGIRPTAEQQRQQRERRDETARYHSF